MQPLLVIVNRNSDEGFNGCSDGGSVIGGTDFRAERKTKKRNLQGFGVGQMDQGSSAEDTPSLCTSAGREGWVRQVKTEFLYIHTTQPIRVLLRREGRARRD